MKSLPLRVMLRGAKHGWPMLIRELPQMLRSSQHDT